MDQTYHFTAPLERFNSNLWGFHLNVPDAISGVFLAADIRRLVCTLNEKEIFQCALMPKGEGSYFININKKLRDKLGLKLGTPVQVSLCKDESEYGLPMPEELQEVLAQDTEGNQLFHALTPGKQRTLLYIAGSVKNQDLRLHRALAIIEHLKMNHGRINFRQLNVDLKNRD